MRGPWVASSPCLNDDLGKNENGCRRSTIGPSHHFMRTHMDCLVVGHQVLDKADQPEFKEDVDWRTLFELD